MTYLYLAVKAWREILIGLLAFLLLICLALLNHKAGQIEKYKHAETVLQADNAKAKASAALKEKQWSEQQLKAEQNYNAKIKQIKSDADIAQSSADSLSKQLKIAGSRLSSASKETIVEYTIANSDILENCITEYRTVAEKADGHAADAERLRDAWPSE
ncbi:hypothetical protein L291_3922 [Acinetobacter guillouiae MSP4-18]|uniref:hypothetical protein n=1 Tax=Acinetobacter guillouiae TaxID=106649 RepID=UPI0002CE3B69|nr:hypothetical protein [Acinetobacter guillouiae]ENU57094.1 hypothetical protein F981_04230 [Acinetobacter guillouiae CIP 63.46]EPH31029.1 hypothetical protein L291_3922 [Acinetobacter guillouiae MSP4-18]KAB0623751.1 hypothetical protein F7P82_20160 [Acinetobacter guillouiae]